MRIPEKLTLDFDLNTSPRVLFAMLATPSGLAKWFADEVDETFGKFVFSWGKVVQTANVISKKESQYIRFRWEDDANIDTYFEFLLAQHELTGNTELIITDFADESEIEDSINLWNTQISTLKRVLGI
jgi:uncharacterized protein YndB with AHSA1/START domain